MAAADGFRLAVYRGVLEGPLDEEEGEMSAIIPARALTQVERLIRGQDGDMGVNVVIPAMFRPEEPGSEATGHAC